MKTHQIVGVTSPVFSTLCGLLWPLPRSPQTKSGIAIKPETKKNAESFIALRGHSKQVLHC
jgi:hypothetical protein